MKLTLQNVTVARAGCPVFEPISLEAEPGTAILLTGANGAGKTTLLRAIAGFVAIASGELRLTSADGSHSVADHCHFIGHQSGIKANLTVRENLAFWAAYLDADAPEEIEPEERPKNRTEKRVQQALSAMALDDLADLPVALLSAGQKRRTALARLKTAYRPIWLLDEPGVSLDAASTAKLVEVINTHLESGGILLAATHEPLALKNARTISIHPALVPDDMESVSHVGAM
ncbi:MAG: heme ABC exporter ATP-binding protein CcmA [Pseudomonadota bacterium]